jgi:uncharacterized protein (TIGR02594 family)
MMKIHFTCQRPSFGGGLRSTFSRGGCGPADLQDHDPRWSPFLDRWSRWDHDDWLPAVPLVRAPGAGAGQAPWMKTAEAEIGVSEKSGKRKANPRILEYFKASRYWGTDDSGGRNAWCGSFVAWVMKQNDITPVAKAFRAKAWENFGQKIDGPVYGAIGIKSRKGGGHVAFIVGRNEDATKYYMLGGNQGDKVQISEYPAKVWTTFVFPPGHDPGSAGVPIYRGGSSLAGSER